MLQEFYNSIDIYIYIYIYNQVVHDSSSPQRRKNIIKKKYSFNKASVFSVKTFKK